MAKISTWWGTLTRKRVNALSKVQDHKALFEESVIAARASGTSFSEELVSSVLARFRPDTELYRHGHNEA